MSPDDGKGIVFGEYCCVKDDKRGAENPATLPLTKAIQDASTLPTEVSAQVPTAIGRSSTVADPLTMALTRLSLVQEISKPLRTTIHRGEEGNAGLKRI